MLKNFAHFLLSQLIKVLIRLPKPMATWLIRLYLRIYPVRMDEAANSDIHSYPNVNAFFTRELAPGIRPIDKVADGIYAPADGRIGAFGALDAGLLIQAKGMPYTSQELCGSEFRPVLEGSYLTLYLAPEDYHRVHCPADLELSKAVRIGGWLWPVDEEHTNKVHGLYCMNRRMVFEFSGPRGRVIVVMVGARNVSAISAAWDWPKKQRVYEPSGPMSFQALDEIGRFNLGSTVIVLTDYELDWSERCATGQRILLGQTLAAARAGSDQA